MPLEKGTVVCSRNGRDKGYFMVVFSSDENNVYLCDGHERPIEHPKKKNIKHICPTSFKLSEEQMRSNKALKRALREFNTNNVKGEI